jgi:hypothetical protein
MPPDLTAPITSSSIPASSRGPARIALDQRQAAAIFGGGATAFSRYEIGKTKLPPALVEFLILLDRHANLLNEVDPRREPDVQLLVPRVVGFS